MLESRALLFLITLAEERHFGRTADRLGVTQSVLSMGIGRLEDRIGTRLFHRGARTAVTLTRAGALLLPEAKAAVDALRQAERIGQLAARGEIGVLNLGYVFSAAVAGPLPALIAHLRQAAPLLDVRLTLLESPEQIEALASGRIDIGLLRPRPSYPPHVETRIVHREGLVVALPADHPFAARATLTAAELVDETFIVPQFQERIGLIETLERLARSGGFALQPPRFTSDFVATLALVAGGGGIALVPQSLAGLGLAGIVHRPIAGQDERIELALAWRADLLPASLTETIATALQPPTT